MMNSSTTFQKAQSYIESLLSKGMVEHSIRVSQIGSQLAQKHDAPPDRVELAGILHDCAKDFTPEEMSKKIAELKIKSSVLDIVSFEVLHGPVGSKMVEKDLLIVDKEILQAIAYHTTGHAQMSLIPRIIFVADFIEWGRDFDYAKIARQMAFEDLQEAILYILAQKMKYLIHKKATIDITTIHAWNSIITACDAQGTQSQ